MNLKIKIIAVVVFILLGITAYELGKSYLKVRKDNKRLNENINAINQDLTYYKSKSNKLVAKNSVLSFRINEFRKSFPKILNEIRDLKLRVNRINSISQTIIHSEKHIETHIKDTLINDTIKARVFNYTDDFYKLHGIAVGDTQKVDIKSTDSLIQVVFKGKRKRPYLWFLSKRRLEQVISNKNPNAKIAYSRFIKIIKK